MIRGSFLGSNKTSQIAYYVYKPEGEIRGILQISHGMCEYMGRYADFAKAMNQQGILVCGNDHAGHGASVTDVTELGYFAETDGWKCLVSDLHHLSDIIKKEYPKVPYFLMGHSMGSFVARAYLSQYGNELFGAIIMGTSGKNQLAPLAFPLVKCMKAVKGERFRSKLINKIAFGTYNVRVKPKRRAHDWISQDEAVVERYENDEYCNFIFTLSGFLDLFYVLSFVSQKAWAKKVPKELPILLLSGSMDPVGGYGKGVTQVYRRLKAAGSERVSMKLYENSRHEILNEQNKDRVYEDITAWINQFI